MLTNLIYKAMFTNNSTDIINPFNKLGCPIMVAENRGRVRARKYELGMCLKKTEANTIIRIGSK